MSELSRRSAIPTSAIKFYLRSGLLAPGTATAQNQADYDDRHVERLALIRALREVVRLPLETIARVTAELDAAEREGWKSDADPIGLALRAAHARPAREHSPEEKVELDRLREELDGVLRKLPWMVSDETGSFAEDLAEPLLEVRRHLYPEYPAAKLEAFAHIAWQLSEVEFAEAPDGARVPIEARGDDIAEPTRRAILSSVLFERIFDGLRRAANTMRSLRISRGTEVPAVRVVASTTTPDDPSAPMRIAGSSARRPE